MNANKRPTGNAGRGSEIWPSQENGKARADRIATTRDDVVLAEPDRDGLGAAGWSVRELRDGITQGSHAPFVVLSKRVPRVGENTVENAGNLERSNSLLQENAAKPQFSDRGHKLLWEADPDPDPVGVRDARSGPPAAPSLAFGDLPTIRSAGTGKSAICIATDSEFVQTDDGKRTIVSLQFAVADPENPRLVWWIVFLPLSRVRLRLTTALREVWIEAELWRHPLGRKSGIGQRGLRMESFAAAGDEVLERKEMVRKRRDRLYKKHGVAINLQSHFGKADLTAFRRGRPDHLKSLTSAAGGLVTLQPFRVCAADEPRHNWFPFSVAVSDTMCHAPAGSKTLDALGAAAGQPKVALPDGAIERMDLLRRDRLLEFLQYSATDPVVVLEYLERLYGANTVPPVTLSSGAAAAFKFSVGRYWVHNCSFKAAEMPEFSLQFGGLIDRPKDVTADENDRSYYERRGKTPVDGAARAVIDACANGYHGGLNAAPIPGFHQVKAYDFDLQGAYPTAMSLVRDVDWAHPDGVIEEVITNRELTLADVPDPLSPFAGWVAFEFPESVKFPALPIFRDGFPMYVRTSGGCPGAQVMGPEVHLALKLDARVYCQIGYQLRPLKLGDGSQSFALRAGVMQMVEDRATAREAFGKKSLEELAIKTMANSTYGKTAQDVAQQNAWDAYVQEMESVGGSAITSPYHAAMTTSFVRAQLLAAANQLTEQGYNFYSVTTDGFISDADLDVVVGLDLHGLAAPAGDARELLANGDRSIWEIKHEQSELLNISTRGNVALNAGGVLAKNSYKTPKDVLKAGGVAERQHFFDLVISRSRRVPNPVMVFPSFRELSYADDRRVDFIASVNNRELSMDYDNKRQPDFDSMRAEYPVDSFGQAWEFASFDTAPWETVLDCERGREVAKNHADSGSCLRTVAQWREWELRRAHGVGRRIADPRRSILLSIVIGHRQGVLGYDVPGLAASAGTVVERLSWLSGFGLGAVKASDWKNSRRPDRVGQMLAPSACEPYLSAIREWSVGTTSRDINERSSGGVEDASLAS